MFGSLGGALVICAVSLVGCAQVSLGPVGGPGGSAFDDRATPSDEKSRLATINITKSRDILGLLTTTDIIHYIENVYGDPSGNVFVGTKHGGGATFCVNLPCEFVVPPIVDFKEGEFLVGICGRAAKFVDAIAFITNEYPSNPSDQFRQCEDLQFGGEGGNPFYLFAPPGHKIRYFFGRSGAAIDSIGIIAEPEPKLAQAPVASYFLGASGGWGGDPFFDPPLDQTVRVDKIIITESCFVSRIQVVYTTTNGTTAPQSVVHGKNGLCPSPAPDPIILPQTFQLEADEYLIGLQGYAGNFVEQLQIVTNKRVLGPFGVAAGGQSFNLAAPKGYKVRRLWGRSDAFIDSIGIIVERGADR